jgi:hypothetical protein
MTKKDGFGVCFRTKIHAGFAVIKSVPEHYLCSLPAREDYYRAMSSVEKRLELLGQPL